jgi:hypothetical protein
MCGQLRGGVTKMYFKYEMYVIFKKKEKFEDTKWGNQKPSIEKGQTMQCQKKGKKTDNDV